jgi:hypothetical protein
MVRVFRADREHWNSESQVVLRPDARLGMIQTLVRDYVPA